MFIFGNDKHSRGSWIEMRTSSGGKALGSGAVLELAGGAKFPANPGVDPYFVTGVSFGQQEKFSAITCFGDVNYVYAFGHDVSGSTAQVDLLVLCTGCDGKVADGLAALTKAYGQSRLSKNPVYSYITLGSLTLFGFLTGMQSNTRDVEHNIQQVTMSIVLEKAQS